LVEGGGGGGGGGGLKKAFTQIFLQILPSKERKEKEEEEKRERDANYLQTHLLSEKGKGKKEPPINKRGKNSFLLLPSGMESKRKGEEGRRGGKETDKLPHNHFQKKGEGKKGGGGKKKEKKRGGGDGAHTLTGSSFFIGKKGRDTLFS